MKIMHISVNFQMKLMLFNSDCKTPNIGQISCAIVIPPKKVKIKFEFELDLVGTLS
jgi:bifunctional pyridoxal-dependent enzyme with beta-cystathionase and maltose regulon repressor activities